MEKTILINGKSGSNKTKGFLFNEVKTLIENEENILFLDSKEEYYNRFSKELKEKGYGLIVLNLKNTKRSNGYNPYALPLHYYENGDKDKSYELLEKLGRSIYGNVYDSDPFWSDMATDLFIALSLMLFKEAPKEKINFGSLNVCIDLVSQGDIIKDYMQNLPANDPIYISGSGTVFSPSDTRGSILAVVKQKIKLYCLRENLMDLLCNTDFDFETFKANKTALFVFTREDNKEDNIIANILIEQILALVMYENIKVSLVLDNIETMHPIQNLSNFIDMKNDNIKIYIATRNSEILKENYRNKNLLENIDKIVNAEEQNIEVEDIKTESVELPTINQKAEYFNIKEKLNGAKTE